MITSFNQIEEKVLALNKKYRIAVASGNDSNTIGAISKAVNKGFIEPVLIGNTSEILKICKSVSLDTNLVKIVGTDNQSMASRIAVEMAKSGEVDIIMKGLVSTDTFLKAVMEKNHGLLLPGSVLSYVGVMEVPNYHKLLFITDPAVIPSPNLVQKTEMVKYSVEFARKFGIEKPKVALIGASEKKANSHFNYTADYESLCKMAESDKLKNCIVDGPLDVFLACDRRSNEIKNVISPINGDADILLFPSLESANPFYKGLMLFAKGKIAGITMGTEKPVVLISRSESDMSKYFSIALACLNT